MSSKTEEESVFMHLANGGVYYPLAPRAQDVSIEAIAHMLATKGRWNGATQHKTYPERILYSVAEHSVYVSEYVEKEMGRPDLALPALLHDAPEHVNGDLIRPLKTSKAFAEPFQRVEQINEEVIAQAFGLEFLCNDQIKIADEAVCTAEHKQVVTVDPAFARTQAKWHDDKLCAKVDIQMLLPYEAKALFLDRYRQVTKLRGAA